MLIPAILCVAPGAEHLAAGLTQETGIPLASVSWRRFPDGEICARVETTLTDRDVFIVQGTHQNQCLRLEELYQLVDVAASQGARRICCVVPYLAFSRQDRRMHVGEPLSGLIVLRTLAMLGAQSCATIDVHSAELFEHAPLPCTSLSSASVFADWLLRHEFRDPLLISPDAGGLQRIQALSALTNFAAAACSKYKDTDGYTWYAEEDLDVQGRDIIVMDDICSSGSTIIPLMQLLRGKGARRLCYAVTHFSANGDLLLAKVGFSIHIIASESIPSPQACVPITPLICEWIRETRSAV